MQRSHLSVGLVCLLILPITLSAETKSNPPKLLLDGFEHGLQGWTYIGGWEFPGAKGTLTLDAGTAHGGKHSLKLQADFRGGGAYVGTWRDLAALRGRDIKELRLWVKATNVSRLGVRIVDSSDQCHQKNGGIPLAATRDWQQVVLSIPALVGGEHWGGANDGKWHGPLKGFGLNIGKDSFAAGSTAQGSISLDDVEVLLGPAIEGQPTLLAPVLNPPSCRPGFGTRLTYRWDAVPMGRDFTVFVHFLAPNGAMAFQADHAPPTPTSIWAGPLEYTRTILVPAQVPDGDYRVVLGLYDPQASDRSWDRPELKAGSGVSAANPQRLEAKDSYQIGTLKVDSRAPLPKLPAPTLNLDGYTMTFREEFNTLSVSARGPGTRWIAHTPTNTDFGDARFVDPKGDTPFKIENGVLRIEAAKENGVWRSGLLASVDGKGRGFAQRYGYFEMRAKFPKSPGMWPAFWLLGQPSVTDRTRTNIEIDVVEHYGVMPNAVFSNLHIWPSKGKPWAQGDCFVVPGLTEDFHSYGVLVDETQITWYFDAVEILKLKTPEEAKVPLYILVDLAMGGGWPTDQARNPSVMEVDYIRVYAKPSQPRDGGR